MARSEPKLPGRAGVPVIRALALSPAWDRTLIVDRVEVGAIHRPAEVVAVAGGKGFNLARAVARLGGDVVAIGVLGGHVGLEVEAGLTADQVPATIVPGGGETRVCTSIFEKSSGQLTEFYEAPAPVTGWQWSQLEAAVTQADPRDWVALSGSWPPPTDPIVIGDLIAAAHSRGALVAVDTSGPSLHAALAAGPDLVKVNEREAEAVLDRDGLGGAALTRRLAAACPTARLVVVTAGAYGAYAWTDRLHRVSTDLRGAYPVGSGDCFLAGVLVGAADGREWSDCLILGSATAAANALRPGPAVFDPAAVTDLVGRTVLAEV